MRSSCRAGTEWSSTMVLNLQVHYTQHAGEHINIHLPQDRMLYQVHHHYRRPHYFYWFLGFFRGMPATVVGLLSSPYRAWEISANLGRGPRGLQWDCRSALSWEEAAGMSITLVVMGHSMPWATDRGPLQWVWQLLLLLQLWWGFCRVGSASLNKLTSTQLESMVAVKTSSSIKETSGSITCQSSTTLCQMAWFTGNQ